VSFDQRHNGVNLAAAVAACDALGVEIDDSLLAGAAAAEISRWRGERLPLPGGGVLIADCYNANPVSMSAALRDLVAVADGRRTVAVLGDMAELGETAEGYHAAVARELADLGIDEVIAIGPLSRAYGGTWYATLAEALEAVPAAIRPGDAVLVKASRAMGLEAVVEAVTA
jgi:UDP-N-acetylmuramoyl-tripeptide--D-alanyl-D-alanine ligase